MFLGTVKLTSLDQDEANLIRGSGRGHLGPHGEGSCSQHPMMNRPEQVPPHSKQILNDTVNVQEPLGVGR